MAITKRRGRTKPWCFDYYDLQPDGRKARHMEFFATKSEAEAAEERWTRSRPTGRPRVDRSITFAAYVAAVLTRHQGEPRTIDCIRATCKNHLIPYFGTQRVRDLSRGDAKALLAEKKNEPIYCRDQHGRIKMDRSGKPLVLRDRRAPASIRIMYSVLRFIGQEAVEDGILDANPFAKLGRKLKLEVKTKARQNAIRKKAMTAEQLRAFLRTAESHTPRFAPLFLLLARTGLRIGEALALRVSDVRDDFRSLHVERELSDDGRTIKVPKTDSSIRDVEVTAQAAVAVKRLVEVDRAKDKLRHGWRHAPTWLFYADVEPLADLHRADGSLDAHGTLDAHNVRRAMRRVLLALHTADRTAGIPEHAAFPPHFTPHSFRHTYASLLIASGKSIDYVQRQLGHEDYTLTVNTYGSWLPHTGPDGSDILDDPTGLPDAQSS